MANAAHTPDASAAKSPPATSTATTTRGRHISRKSEAEIDKTVFGYNAYAPDPEPFTSHESTRTPDPEIENSPPFDHDASADSETEADATTVDLLEAEHPELAAFLDGIKLKKLLPVLAVGMRCIENMCGEEGPQELVEDFGLSKAQARTLLENASLAFSGGAAAALPGAPPPPPGPSSSMGQPPPTSGGGHGGLLTAIRGFKKGTLKK